MGLWIVIVPPCRGAGGGAVRHGLPAKLAGTPPARRHPQRHRRETKPNFPHRLPRPSRPLGGLCAFGRPASSGSSRRCRWLSCRPSRAGRSCGRDIRRPSPKTLRKNRGKARRKTGEARASSCHLQPRAALRKSSAIARFPAAAGKRARAADARRPTGRRKVSIPSCRAVAPHTLVSVLPRRTRRRGCVAALFRPQRSRLSLLGMPDRLEEFCLAVVSVLLRALHGSCSPSVPCRANEGLVPLRARP